ACKRQTAAPAPLRLFRPQDAPQLRSPWGQNLALNRALGLAASHTLSAKFPCMCPVHPHMSAGRDFFDRLTPPPSCKAGAFYMSAGRDFLTVAYPLAASSGAS